MVTLDEKNKHFIESGNRISAIHNLVCLTFWARNREGTPWVIHMCDMVTLGEKENTLEPGNKCFYGQTDNPIPLYSHKLWKDSKWCKYCQFFTIWIIQCHLVTRTNWRYLLFMDIFYRRSLNISSSSTVIPPCITSDSRKRIFTTEIGCKRVQSEKAYLSFTTSVQNLCLVWIKSNHEQNIC
jgi:hypothetical protein